MEKIKTAVIGPGNIGTDLIFKIKRSQHMEIAMVVGRRKSEGLQRAANMGIDVSPHGASVLADRTDIKIVFDATSASGHLENAPLLKEAGKIVFDLTPAAVGPFVVPCVNLGRLGNVDNYNLVTCGGQATVPIAYAVNRAANTEYAEIIACIASKSAGPGTRSSIDEFTQTTAKALRTVAGADRSKAIIILNPAEPPLLMTNTIHSFVRDPDKKAIEESVNDIVQEVQKYVPNYRLRVPPIIDGNKVTVIIQVEGAGDYLPKYSGNLDIHNAAAAAAADIVAGRVLRGER